MVFYILKCHTHWWSFFNWERFIYHKAHDLPFSGYNDVPLLFLLKNQDMQHFTKQNVHTQKKDAGKYTKMYLVPISLGAGILDEGVYFLFFFFLF